MNARLNKESRILRPARFAGLGLLALAALAGGSVSATTINLILAHWAGCCLIAVAAFSSDWSHGGLTLSLAQPIPRGEIWREKLDSTLRAFAVQTAALFILAALSLAPIWPARPLIETAMAVVVATVFLIPVGFWIALKVGNPKASIILSLLAVLLLVVGGFGVVALLEIFPLSEALSTPLIPMAALSLVIGPPVFSRAKSLLLKWDYYHPLRQEHALGFSSRAGARATGHAANFRALLSKELHLQQTNFLFIVGMLVCGALIPLENYRWGALSMMCSLIALFAPALLGIGAVCEEHRLGTTPQQITLPAGVARQWWIKHLLVVVTGSLLGAACIWASRALVAGTTHSSTPLSFFKIGVMSTFIADPVDPTYVALYLGSVIVTSGVGMWIAATFHRYAPSVAVTALLYVASSLVIPSITAATFAFGTRFQDLHRHTELLVIAFGACLLPVATFFGITNLRRQRANLRSAVAQVLAFVACLIVGAGSAHAIYLRAWELVLPERPAGPPIIDREQYASFLPDLSRGMAVDHLGRIWKTTFTHYWGPSPRFHIKDSRPIWKSAVAGFNHYVALHTNGTLWVKGREIFVRSPNQRIFDQVWQPDLPAELTRIGSDSDWNSLDGAPGVYLAIKSDGSLWSWGSNRMGAFGDTNRGTAFLHPQQVGDSTDWKQACSTGFRNFALKRDGMLWHWGHWSVPHVDSNGRHGTKAIYFSFPQMLTNRFDGKIDAIRYRQYPRRLLARLTDGTVARIPFLEGEEEFRVFGRPENPALLDPTVDWRAVAVIDGWMIGHSLTADGRIIVRADRPTPSLPASIDGKHDWVSFQEYWLDDSDVFLGLKSDGSLWRFKSAAMPWSFDAERNRLPPRWRPERIGRLFPEFELDD